MYSVKSEQEFPRTDPPLLMDLVFLTGRLYYLPIVFIKQVKGWSKKG